MEHRISRRRSAVILLFIIASPVFLSAASWWPPSILRRFTVKPLAVGVQAPQFELASVTGEKVSLAGFKGKPMLIKFWSAG
ncbi:redoxin domain-containing protein [Candidatus Poribacteria bacterium]|nr:redoxin domain-containing protein [Candidatus Poribacteria bacterium]